MVPPQQVVVVPRRGRRTAVQPSAAEGPRRAGSLPTQGITLRLVKIDALAAEMHRQGPAHSSQIGFRCAADLEGTA